MVNKCAAFNALYDLTTEFSDCDGKVGKAFTIISNDFFEAMDDDDIYDQITGNEEIFKDYVRDIANALLAYVAE